MGNTFQCQKMAASTQTTMINIKPENIKILALAGLVTSKGFGVPSAR